MGNLVLIIILLLVGLVLFGRWKDSSVNMMAAAEDSFAMRYFGWRWKTFALVLQAVNLSHLEHRKSRASTPTD